ncbi:hypothetical protein GIB67_009466 [Kingdonia uniflora]|uniref:WW domain-containing protein n=1 Tax=Kingdonia uniflora TaxID=39325 RepID=A0A7J7N387_9MAGN|nr:hypothetical protein GIB67_009466 [Kingdonia uniflora]
MASSDVMKMTKSLQNCSLNGSDAVKNDDPTIELNSEVALPYEWEQILDLKTGELYYVNGKTGMKQSEDPRKTATLIEDLCCSGDEDDSSVDSEGSTSDSFSPSSSLTEHYVDDRDNKDNVLVVAGCRGCLMYFMLPRSVQECPRCRTSLLHFDQPQQQQR